MNNPSIDNSIFPNAQEVPPLLLSRQERTLYITNSDLNIRLFTHPVIVQFHELIGKTLHPHTVVTHAQATIVSIVVQRQNNGVELLISDNGTGFNVSQIKKGTGLKRIYNRVFLTNCTLQIQSAPGSGTTQRIQFKTETPKFNNHG